MSLSLMSVFHGQTLQGVWVVMRYWRSMTLIPSWGWRWSLWMWRCVSSSWRATALEQFVSLSPSTRPGFSLCPRSSQWKPSSRPAHISWISTWTSWSFAYSTFTCRRYALCFCLLLFAAWHCMHSHIYQKWSIPPVSCVVDTEAAVVVCQSSYLMFITLTKQIQQNKMYNLSKWYHLPITSLLLS